MCADLHRFVETSTSRGADLPLLQCADTMQTKSRNEERWNDKHSHWLSVPALLYKDFMAQAAEWQMENCAGVWRNNERASVVEEGGTLQVTRCRRNCCCRF